MRKAHSIQSGVSGQRGGQGRGMDISIQEVKKKTQEADMETLIKMSESAFSEYYRLAVKPCTAPSKADFEPLERATAICEAIRDERAKRLGAGGPC